MRSRHAFGFVCTSIVAVPLVQLQYSLAAREEMSCVLEKVEADLFNAVATDDGGGGKVGREGGSVAVLFRLTWDVPWCSRT